MVRSLVVILFIFYLDRLLPLALALLDFILEHLHHVNQVLLDGSRRFLVFILYLDIDLLAVNHNFQRGFNTKSNLPAVYTQHRHLDIIADGNRLPQLPCQYQHVTLRGEISMIILLLTPD